jgi:hypothetical protein
MTEQPCDNYSTNVLIHKGFNSGSDESSDSTIKNLFMMV